MSADAVPSPSLESEVSCQNPHPEKRSNGNTSGEPDPKRVRTRSENSSTNISPSSPTAGPGADKLSPISSVHSLNSPDKSDISADDKSEHGVDDDGKCSDKSSRSERSSVEPELPSTSRADGDATGISRSSRTVNKCFNRDPNRYHLLLGVTGSVAAIKVPELIDELNKHCPGRLSIRVIATKASGHFVDWSQLEGRASSVYHDCDEWDLWQQRGDPVLHIELRRWADGLLLAPLDANTMAKIANGLCDNLLTCVVRAWDPAKSVYFAPAMNTYMWENPLTFRHLEVLKSLLNFREIPPMEKELICGDKGYGAMAPTQMIASVLASDVKNKFAFFSTH